MDSKRFEALRPFVPIAVCLAMGLFASSLRASPPDSWRSPGEIRVHTVEELYAAVNSNARCGVTSSCAVRIHLAPGTYVLTNLDPHGRTRPHNGSLRMRPGVSLVGSEVHVDTNGDGVLDPVDPEAPDDFAVPGTETTIDGSALVLGPEERMDCAREGRAIFPDPVIYLGRNNSISALSFVGGHNVGIGSPTNDPIEPDGSLSIEISDTVLQADVLTLDFSNSECAARRARSVLSLSHSVLRGAGAIGVHLANFYTGDWSNDPSDGPEIRATVAFNLFYNNGTALRAAAGDEGTDGGTVILHMMGNVFRNNATNLQARGAVGRVELPTVGNRLVVRSDFDTFGEANLSLYLIAGAFAGPGDAVGNTIEAEFFGSHFLRDSRDAAPEITIGGESGSDNHAEVLIRQATVTTSQGRPVEGALSIDDETSEETAPNTARLRGSRRDFIRMNQGLPAPPEHFFLEH
jgi:hypothetical protein